MNLVRGVDSDVRRQAIVKGIVVTCQLMGTELIAEGVETKAERDCLVEMGIDLIQGYWFSKPAFQALAVVEQTAWD
jgi:EAL domain-containing protein (putative c-di-GMP-specific phosphodiesterase class I)